MTGNDQNIVRFMNVDDRGKLTDHVSLGVLTRIVPRYVVDEVIAETGRLEKRSRLLPAHVVVYFVLALSLFADGYEEVIRKLVHGLRFARTWSKEWQTPTTGALSQARARLGEEPLQALFETVAVPIAKAGTPGAWLRNWRLMALDGVMIDMPDTPQNRAVFHKPEGGTRRPFPQSRTVGLTEVGTHAVIAVTIGTIRTGERELAKALLDSITPDMLVVADRGFYSFDLWRDYRCTGADLLWRLSAGVRLPVLNRFPDGSYLSEITNQPGAARPGSPRTRSPTSGSPPTYQFASSSTRWPDPPSPTSPPQRRSGSSPASPTPNRSPRSNSPTPIINDGKSSQHSGR
jgi:Insertion element 4 transposase N-terminal/Transposase DDE domain